MVKKLLQSGLLVVGILFLTVPVQAQEKIDVYDTSIVINEDATITVEETIHYDFGSDQRHGIYRDIPVKYKARGGTFKLRIDNISVVDGSGAQWNFKKEKSGNDLRLKIGDANKYVTGKQKYVITYTVARALNYFDDHIELYWNVIGAGWGVPMEKVHARISTPAGVEIQESVCFAGTLGTREGCLNRLPQEQEVYFGHDHLDPFSVFTVVVGVPPASIIEPSLWQKTLWIVRDNWVLFVPVIVLVYMYGRWLRHGKDPRGRGTIVPHYEAPEGLTPAEVGTVIDENTQTKDISATLVDLAVRGYIKIRKIDGESILAKDDYELTKLKSENELSVDFEKKLVSKIFGSATTKQISDLKNKFYTTIPEIRKDIYAQTVEKKFFAKSPRQVRSFYGGIGGFIVFSSFFLGGFLGGLAIAAIAVSGVIVLSFAFFMPQRTHKGVLMREQIEGLKLYLETAEKDRINFHNAPEKKPEQFEKLLPYAMVLGVEKAWAGQFSDIYTENPTWYESSTPMNALLLSDSLSTFSSKAGSTMTSSPSSSASSGGSGFSSGGGGGGGFGGGGGGSW